MALRRIYGMLKKGGIFYLHDVVFPLLIQDSDSYFNKLITGLKKFAGDKIAKETKIHIRDEFSALNWIMERLLKSAGFFIESVKCGGLVAGYLCNK
jgi:hypothetical protein